MQDNKSLILLASTIHFVVRCQTKRIGRNEFQNQVTERKPCRPIRRCHTTSAIWYTSLLPKLFVGSEREFHKTEFGFQNTNAQRHIHKLVVFLCQFV